MTPEDAATSHGPRGPRIVVALAALVVVVLHGSAITHYGYFRDELYYLACAQHLAFGYVDHPPFSIAVLALVRAALGTSLVALRLVPMLANVATLVLTGEIVRAMRGGVFATAVACTAQALAPVFLAFGHFYSMNSLDSVFWALAAWLFLRILDAPTTPRWLALGVVLGLGLENKASILWLGAGIAVALLAYRRDLLKTRGPWLAALYEAALGAKPESSEKKEMGPLPQLYADMFGWSELADAVAVAAATLTPEERAHAGVLSRSGYGAAAAIELLGPPRGLPHGISGHNNFYLWGPREADGRAMILMGGERSWAEERFASVTEVTTFDCPLCMPYEKHKTIFVARGMKQPLREFWEERRYFE